jgi:diacylglycerol kinase family enzyme
LAENIKHLVLVPLPYGTGNDLSRSLGWSYVEGSWGRSLEKTTQVLVNASREKFTVWDVSIYAQQIHGFDLGGLAIKEAS